MRKVTDARIRAIMETPRTLREGANKLGVSRESIRLWMKEMGLQPWGKPFAQGYQVRCLDGHKVDSLGEAKIDDWLFETGILHEVHKKLQGIPCIIDFWLPDYQTGIEYVGVEGILEYDECIKEKKTIYATWKISVIWAYPETSFADFQAQLQEVAKHE